MNNKNPFLRSLLFASHVVLFSFLGGVFSASAALITRADFSGSETLETFSSSVPAGPLVSLNGVNYSSLNSILFTTNRDTFFPNVPDISLGGALNDNAATSDITIDFTSSVNRFGFYLSSGGSTSWLVSVFYDANQLLGTNTYSAWGLNPSVGAAFVGFEFTDNINSVRIQQTGGSGFAFVMDDLRFESVASIDEPALIAWLGALFLILFSVRKKRLLTVTKC